MRASCPSMEKMDFYIIIHVCGNNNNINAVLLFFHVCFGGKRNTTCTVPGSSCIIVLSLGHNKSLDNALWLVVAVCSYLNLGPQAKEAFRWVGLCSRICTSQVGKQEEEHHWWWWERMVRPTSSTNGWWVMSSPAFFFLNFCFCMQVMIRRRRSGRRVVCNCCLFVIARCVNENTNMQWHVYFFVFLSGFASGGK